MTQIHRLKKVPIEVLEWFKLNFPDMQYHFYWYGSAGLKIYGCEVCDGYFEVQKRVHGEDWRTEKVPHLVHNATQACIDWFKQNQIKFYNNGGVGLK